MMTFSSVSVLFPLQLSCPVTTRRKRLTTPAREASTGWTAFPRDPQTPLTPRRRPPEAEWRLRWRVPESRRSWTLNSLKTSAWRSRYHGEPGWRIRWGSGWDQNQEVQTEDSSSYVCLYVLSLEINLLSSFHRGQRNPSSCLVSVTASSWSVGASEWELFAGWWRSPSSWVLHVVFLLKYGPHVTFLWAAWNQKHRTPARVV